MSIGRVGNPVSVLGFPSLKCPDILLLCLQPGVRNEEFVVALSPITHDMYMRNSIPRDGARVFSHNDLELSRHGI
jgi:hypothetical protein